MRRFLVAIPIILAVATFSTPAPAPNCTSGCTMKVETPVDTSHHAIASAVTPPDPCSKVKPRAAHERCVTRQLNKGIALQKDPGVGKSDAHVQGTQPASNSKTRQ